MVEGGAAVVWGAPVAIVKKHTYLTTTGFFQEKFSGGGANQIFSSGRGQWVWLALPHPGSYTSEIGRGRRLELKYILFCKCLFSI